MPTHKPFYLQLPFLYVIFFFVNLLNFLDRGIIPGATNEINKFIEDHVDTDTPDVYLGLLQSAFIIGFMVGSVIFGHLIHTKRRFTLTGIGCGIWIGAVVASGGAYYMKSYTFLIFARIFSGVGEASLQCCIPPWIQTTAPPHQRGMWLAVFYTAISVGTALGYAYSSILAESIGWQYGFFIEAMLMFPFVLFMFFISPHFPVDTSQLHETHGPHGVVVPVDEEEESVIVQEAEKLTLWQECRNICNRPVFVAVSFGTAAQTATLIGLSTFGSAFVMGLGFFDTESEASSVFGILVSIAGIIATPVGGILLDRILTDPKHAHRHYTADTTTATDTAGDTAEDTAAGDASLAPLIPPTTPYNTTSTSEVEEEVHEVEQSSPSSPYTPQVARQLRKITWMVFGMACTGSTLIAMVYFVTGKALFLVLITTGFGVLFLCNSAMNMAVMLSVPSESKSLGIALNIICLHGLGDVPAPVFVGLLKDSLAPGCIPGSGSGSGTVTGMVSGLFTGMVNGMFTGTGSGTVTGKVSGNGIGMVASMVTGKVTDIITGMVSGIGMITGMGTGIDTGMDTGNGIDTGSGSNIVTGMVTGTEDDDGNIAASDACRADAPGLRLTMLLASLWLLWFVFWFFVAYLCTRYRYYLFTTTTTHSAYQPLIGEEGSDQGGAGSGRGSAVKERRGLGPGDSPGEEIVISSIRDMHYSSAHSSGHSSGGSVASSNYTTTTTATQSPNHTIPVLPSQHTGSTSGITGNTNGNTTSGITGTGTGGVTGMTYQHPEQEKENVRTNSSDILSPPPQPHKLSTTHSRVLSKEELPHATLQVQQENVDRLKRLSRDSTGNTTGNHTGNNISNNTGNSMGQLTGNTGNRSLSWLSSPEAGPEDSNLDTGTVTGTVTGKKKKESLGKRIRHKLLGHPGTSSSSPSSPVPADGIPSRTSSSTFSLSPTIHSRSGPGFGGEDLFYDQEDIIMI